MKFLHSRLSRRIFEKSLNDPIGNSGARITLTPFKENPPESIATLLPFGPIEGHKWFFKISSQSESQKNRFAFTSFGKIQRRYDMNGKFQMQGGKNWILPKEINANRFFRDSQWLEIWSNHLFPSTGTGGESPWLWTQFLPACI